MSEPTSSLSDLIGNVISAARSQRGDGCSNELRDALNALANHPQRLDARPQIAARLVDCDSPTGAGLLAVWLGAGVEGGLDPEPSTLPILDAMLKWTKTIRTDPEDSDGEQPVVDEDTAAGLQRLGQALVAHFGRNPVQRAQIAAREHVIAELERVEHASAGPLWVLEALRKRSGELLVIHIEGQRGFRVSYQNISNCFHLFTLLQGALAGVMPLRESALEDVLAVALGDAALQVSDSAWWHYGDGNHPQADLGGSIWGEAGPDSIPSIDGEQVLLLWPMLLESRRWDSGFFGPHLAALPANVTVNNELTTEQLGKWWTRLRLPVDLPESAVPSKPWWKIW